MSTPAADRTPRRTTGQPAKDSGGGTIWHALERGLEASGNGIYARLARLDEIAAALDWRVRVLDFELYGGPLPFPPDDYGRHWELEGPHA